MIFLTKQSGLSVLIDAHAIKSVEDTGSVRRVRYQIHDHEWSYIDVTDEIENIEFKIQKAREKK